MFDIAWSELLLIAVIALIFIGPKELPQVLHNLGRMTAKLRRSADDFRRQFEDSVREAGYEDLHKNIQDFRSLHPANQLKDSISRAINQDYTPKPVAPGTQVPADPLLTVENKAPLSAAPEPVSVEGANNAPVEKPSLLEPKAPVEAAKDRVAPAA
jgi:sec-independent protein translocase protein TatB